MPTSAFTKVYTFGLELLTGHHDFTTHTIKVMLTNTVPVQTNTVRADLTDISAGNGYTAGGSQVTFGTLTQTTGTAKVVLNDVTFTASGGSIGPARYAALYNDTSTGDLLIGWWDYGSSITLADGESLVVDLDAAAGVLTAA